MKAQHTAGPLTGKGVRILTESGKEIGRASFSIPSNRSLPKMDVAAQNAKLWAAAPELLDALQQCLAALNAAFDSKVDGDVFGIHHNDATDALIAAEKAIAKALGE